MTEILDACATLAYLRGEPGAQAVEALLRDPARHCCAHAVNLCEVYYDFLRRADAATADEAIRDLVAAGVAERSDIDPAFWRSVGAIKARGRISLADCFCIALAHRERGEVVTSDHHEFDPLASSGICQVHFIR